MRKKKIIRIISRLNIGGPAIHTILLSSSLNEDGYEDILICGKVSKYEGDMHSFARDKNVEPLLIPELGREISFYKDIKAFSKLYSIIRKEKPDIVHTHTAKAGALGRLAAILNGVPIKVHTFHGHVFDSYFSPIKSKIFLFVERFLALFTDMVIVVSETVKDDIVKRRRVIKDKNCVVIPLGLELEEFLNSQNLKGIFRKKFGINDNMLLVGIIGRLVPIKNHRMFLDIAKKMKTNSPNTKVKFIIVGDGELREQIKDYTYELGLKDDVIFTGWAKDLASVYTDLDIVALTSLNEGTPVSLIEAMAAGKPIIATNVGGVKDLVKTNVNGLLARPGDIDDFCAKLTSFLNDPQKRKEFGRQGRISVIKKYSKERLVNDLELLYQELLSRKGKTI